MERGGLSKSPIIRETGMYYDGPHLVFRGTKGDTIIALTPEGIARSVTYSVTDSQSARTPFHLLSEEEKFKLMEALVSPNNPGLLAQQIKPTKEEEDKIWESLWSKAEQLMDQGRKLGLGPR